MKILKYIGIGVLVIIGLIFGPTLAMAFGACAFLGFIIIAGLDALGIIKLSSNLDFNTIAAISFAIGLVIFIIYFAITGIPEM